MISIKSYVFILTCTLSVVSVSAEITRESFEYLEDLVCCVDYEPISGLAFEEVALPYFSYSSKVNAMYFGWETAYVKDIKTRGEKEGLVTIVIPQLTIIEEAEVVTYPVGDWPINYSSNGIYVLNHVTLTVFINGTERYASSHVGSIVVVDFGTGIEECALENPFISYMLTNLNENNDIFVQERMKSAVYSLVDTILTSACQLSK